MILVAATTSHAASHAATGGASPPGQTGPVEGPAPLSEQLGRVQLSVGSTGPAVRTLQRILNAKRFGRVDESGVFDPRTRDALQRFQAKARLAALEQEQHMLAERIARFGALPDPLDIWTTLGLADAADVPMLEIDAFRAAAAGHRIGDAR